MSKLILFIAFPLFAFSQHIDYEILSDQQLRQVLQKELLDMESRGATPKLIMDKFVTESGAYIQSRESYYRFLVHTEYMFDKLMTMKMEEGTDKPSDFERIRKIKEPKSYQDYLDHKKTDAAKEQWENSTHDGILKLVVDNHEHYTEAEQKRYDGLIILLNRDPFFTSFHITDGQTVKVIMPVRNETP